METILQKAEQGEYISPAEAKALFRITDNRLLETLYRTAHSIKVRLHGERVSYIVNQNINFTNICKLNCLFCAYKVPYGDTRGYLLSVDEVLGMIDRNPRMTEVSIQGGIHPDVEPSYYYDLLHAISDTYPHLHIHAFSPMEVYYLAERSGSTIPHVLHKLKEKGLGSLCGTAAEIFDTQVRASIAPAKIDTQAWKATALAARDLGIPMTATMLFGHVETVDHIVEHLDILRELQMSCQPFTEFIPLLFIPYNTPLGRKHDIRSQASPDLIYKVYSISRIFFQDTIRNLQTSWVKLGIDTAKKTLSLGVNDIGGTLLYENITRSAGGQYESCFNEEQLRQSISEAGFRPARRDTVYSSFED